MKRIAPCIAATVFAAASAATVFAEAPKRCPGLGALKSRLTLKPEAQRTDVDRSYCGNEVWNYLLYHAPAGARKEFNDPNVSPDQQKAILGGIAKQYAVMDKRIHGLEAVVGKLNDALALATNKESLDLPAKNKAFRDLIEKEGPDRLLASGMDKALANPPVGGALYKEFVKQVYALREEPLVDKHFPKSVGMDPEKKKLSLAMVQNGFWRNDADKAAGLVGAPAICNPARYAPPAFCALDWAQGNKLRELFAAAQQAVNKADEFVLTNGDFTDHADPSEAHQKHPHNGTLAVIQTEFKEGIEARRVDYEKRLKEKVAAKLTETLDKPDFQFDGNAIQKGDGGGVKADQVSIVRSEDDKNRYVVVAGQVVDKKPVVVPKAALAAPNAEIDETVVNDIAEAFRQSMTAGNLKALGYSIKGPQASTPGVKEEKKNEKADQKLGGPVVGKEGEKKGEEKAGEKKEGDPQVAGQKLGGTPDGKQSAPASTNFEDYKGLAGGCAGKPDANVDEATMSALLGKHASNMRARGDATDAVREARRKADAAYKEAAAKCEKGLYKRTSSKAKCLQEAQAVRDAAIAKVVEEQSAALKDVGVLDEEKETTRAALTDWAGGAIAAKKDAIQGLYLPSGGRRGAASKAVGEYRGSKDGAYDASLDFMDDDYVKAYFGGYWTEARGGTVKSCGEKMTSDIALGKADASVYQGLAGRFVADRIDADCAILDGKVVDPSLKSDYDARVMRATQRPQGSLVEEVGGFFKTVGRKSDRKDLEKKIGGDAFKD